MYLTDLSVCVIGERPVQREPSLCQGTIAEVQREHLQRGQQASEGGAAKVQICPQRERDAAQANEGDGRRAGASEEHERSAHPASARLERRAECVQIQQAVFLCFGPRL